ncbi:class I SAM-dependent methyltransferase [Tropicibacter sp. Alg240-R139]|uniref:class I SAM-dependent methyltransferase n=1 Tax=Tropicibacter sp. Alg240-R139 TaxID=2305991 RepID=UPI0013E0CAE4|nr:class I SAM-dependent methyltransferase [Tropicibacter sp. Alg240-R139]
MTNYEYVVQWAEKTTPKNGKMLDYGCGAGAIVDLARRHGVNAFGCDVFYDGGDYSGEVLGEKFGETIFRMEGDTIPFPENYFDIVVSNQVLEHVPDLDVVVSEMARVLKPGGKVLSMFPDRGVWREGHCGVPFLHWFPKGSSFRVNYAMFWRALGGGYHHGEKNVRQWSEEFCKWLDDWTYYRSVEEIDEVFEKYFSPRTPLEADLFVKRTGRRGIPFKSIIVRKMAHLAFENEKINLENE